MTKEKGCKARAFPYPAVVRAAPVSWVDVDMLDRQKKTRRCSVALSNSIRLRAFGLFLLNNHGEIDPEETLVAN